MNESRNKYFILQDNAEDFENVNAEPELEDHNQDDQSNVSDDEITNEPSKQKGTKLANNIWQIIKKSYQKRTI